MWTMPSYSFQNESCFWERRGNTHHNSFGKHCPKPSGKKNKKRKTYFQKSKIMKVTQKNYSNCMLGNKDQKKNLGLYPFILAPISLVSTSFNPGLHWVESWHGGFGSCWHLHHAGFHPLILPTAMLPQLPPGCRTSPATTPGLPAPCQGKKQGVKDWLQSL